MKTLRTLLASLVASLAPPADHRDETAVAAALGGLADFVAAGGLDADAGGGAALAGRVDQLVSRVAAHEDVIVRAEATLAALAEKAGTLDAVPQLRADLDAACEQLRALGRHSARGLSAPAVIAPTMEERFARPVMRFPCDDDARIMAEFALDVRHHSKDLTPIDDADGGYAMPREISPVISRMIDLAGTASKIGRRVPMGASGFRKLRRVGGVPAFFKAPGALATEAAPTFGAMELTPETLMAFVEVDLEFDEASAVELGNYLATEFAYGIARKEDTVAWSGTGAPADGGIVGILNSDRVTFVTMVTGDDAFTDLTFDHLVDMEAAVAETALSDTRWLFHRTVKALVKKLKDSGGSPIWQPPAGDEPSTILGYLHSVSGLMPGTGSSAASTPFLAFGDFYQGLYIGRRGDLRIDYSDDAGFKQYQRWWRAIERIDMAVNGYTAAEIAEFPELANPIVVLKTGATS